MKESICGRVLSRFLRLSDCKMERKIVNATEGISGERRREREKRGGKEGKGDFSFGNL